MFKRKANRLCVLFDGIGLVPVATEKDDQPIFLTSLPEKIGDEALIEAEGKIIKVMLLKSTGHLKDRTYLVAV